MKNKVIWAVALPILIFTVFFGVMHGLQKKGIFYLSDLEGQREYLTLFPLEGIAGDGTQGISFRLEDGELTTKFYPFDTEQIKNIVFAERRGLTGFEKYSYNYYKQENYYDFSRSGNVFSSTDSAPSKDAKIQHKDSFNEELLEDFDLQNAEFVGGETVIADKIDVYLSFFDVDNGRWARVPTGMTLQDKPYYYTRGDYAETNSFFTHSAFNDAQINAICIKLGDAYFSMAIPSKECQGKTTLYRVNKEDLVKTPDEGKIYDQKEYGKATALCAFPVGEDNHILGMFKVGEQSIGIFRTQKDSLFFELYNTEGTLVAQDLLTNELGKRVDQAEADVVSWNERDASIYFRTYEIVKQKDGSEAWETVVNGMYQFDEKGLKRMNCYGDGGRLLSVCRNNLIFDVSMVNDEEKLKLPYYYGYQVYLTVMNGDTEKVLYRGQLVTDYDEDIYKMFSIYDIAKSAPYLEEAMKNYYGDSIITQRQRQIMEVIPINGKVENSWWR
ncbi:MULTISPECIES: hypothetical protein [Anaerotignum]|uniref:hypothetical protein n=1 Tax=Anaerotignum TaxID=2039240 RepID=UPI00210F1280|nr:MULTISPECIES: hypothetical protein [Anaerotignum]MCQ4937065.1 hypothetical protein [Anaerotignum propionicum]